MISTLTDVNDDTPVLICCTASLQGRTDSSGHSKASETEETNYYHFAMTIN